MALVDGALSGYLLSRGNGETTIVDDVALAAEIILPLDPDKAETHNGQISLYTVRAGDSLSQVAEMFGVSVNTIVWANDLERSDLIQEGQLLVILPISGVRHTVAKGDTLAALAKKYNGDVDDIVKWNDLDPEAVLTPGAIVMIPGGQLAAAATPAKTSAATATVTKITGPEYAGYYRRPIDGGVRTQGIHGYNAVDLAAAIGTPIYAAADGTVIVSKTGGWNGGYGNYVVVRHYNGTQTLYAHNSRNAVALGASVKKGEIVAYLGSSGNSTGPHVHFEIRGAKNPF